MTTSDNKFNSLDDITKFLEGNKLPKLTQKERETYKESSICQGNQFVFYNIQTQKF